MPETGTKNMKCKCRRSIALSQRAINELSREKGMRIEVTLKAQCDDCKGVHWSTTKIEPRVEVKL